MGGEGFEIERAKEKRRGKLFDAIDEDQQRRRRQRSLGKRQMNLAEGLGCGSPKRARGMIEGLRDAAKPRIDTTGCNGEETGGIGIDEAVS